MQFENLSTKESQIENTVDALVKENELLVNQINRLTPVRALAILDRLAGSRGTADAQTYIVNRSSVKTRIPHPLSCWETMKAVRFRCGEMHIPTLFTGPWHAHCRVTTEQMEFPASTAQMEELAQ